MVKHPFFDGLKNGFPLTQPLAKPFTMAFTMDRGNSCMDSEFACCEWVSARPKSPTHWNLGGERLRAKEVDHGSTEPQGVSQMWLLMATLVEGL